MSRSDDSNVFPPGRRRRQPPTQTAAGWDRDDHGRGDWRYPDPIARYGQDDEDYEAPPRGDRYADEWQAARPARDGRFRPAEPAAPSWDMPDAQDDPFDWDAPDPPAETAWGAGDYADDDGRDSFATRDPWSDEAAFDTPRRAEPAPRSSMRDDSLFRRIDGSTQDPDLASLTARQDPHGDPYGADMMRDPAELRDRFFTHTEPEDDPYAAPEAPYAAPADAPPAGNIFDFEAHRAPATAQTDDPYRWDVHDDETPLAAPDVAAPAQHYNYAADDDPYAYGDDPHYHDDDLDADFLDDEAELDAPPPAQPKSRRKLMVAGVLVAAVATGGGAAFVYKSYQDGSLGDMSAPTLLADGGPVKGEPSDPGGRDFPDGNKQIYDRLSGPAAQPENNASSGSGDTSAIPGIVTTGAEAPADTLDERIAAALRKSGKPAGETTSVAPADSDSPRPVRTLTVRPDGSVVPAQTQASPEMPDASETVTTAGIVSTTGSGASSGMTASRSGGGDATPSNADSSSSQQQAESPAPEPERAAPRPAETNQQETRVASVQPETATSATTSTAAANPYFVQIAARRDQTSALAAFADLQQRYPSILDGLAPTIKKADLGDKGVWYRLWVGPMNTRGNAQDICGKLKQAGLGGCFVRTE